MRTQYNYTTKNDLSSLIKFKRAELTVEHGRRFLIGDVEKQLAEHCEVSLDFIKAIKRGMCQPSLAVALKIAEYFNNEVETIFRVTDKR